MKPQTIQENFLKTANRFGKMRYDLIFKELSRRELEMLISIQRFTEENPGQEGIYVSHLAKILKVSSPAVSRMIGGLEEKGYIERKTNKEDRRNTYILLTQKGIEEKHRADVMMQNLADRILQKMGEEDMMQLIRLWNQLADVMEEELKGEKYV